MNGKVGVFSEEENSGEKQRGLQSEYALFEISVVYRAYLPFLYREISGC
jgi:hypothetical protein